MRLISAAALCAALTPVAAQADGPSALDHAPIGVMGDHRHGKGEVMVSYRLMHMDMAGTQIGDEDVDPDTVVTTIPNRFAGMPGQPPTLRIVPTEMRMDMHMVGIMYGLSDRVTLMAMGSYLTKEMDHVTYQGGMGTTPLGTFRTAPSGFGDTKIGAMIGLTDTVHATAGISLPTGSLTEEGEALTPMGMTMPVRLPYPMQLGSGTFDLEPALTYADTTERLGWGAQVKGTIRLGTNDEAYALGNKAMATAWLAYAPVHSISLSARIEAETTGRIDGIDPVIMGPVQTANPDFSGGDRVTALAGVNLLGTGNALRGWRLGIEGGVPLYQDLNGPQMPQDWSLTVGVQKAF